MITDSSIEIEAPADLVWGVYVDVERWAAWTASIERIVALDGPGIEVGKRFEIKQPKFPKLVWEVTEVDPGVSWTWRQKSLTPDAIARAIRYALEQPEGVDVNEIIVRPTAAGM